MFTSWKRPEALQDVQVWHTFKCKNPSTDEIEEFFVQDLPKERFEDALKFMLHHFLSDEPICKLKNVIADENALQQIFELWRNVMQQKVTLACFKKGCDELVGLNMLCVLTKNDTIELNVPKCTWISVHDFALAKHNLFEHYPFTDRTLIAYGLSVSKKYRQRGIATEILRARIPLCKMLNIPLTSTVFTAIGSQKPAEKIGFQVDEEWSYDDPKLQQLDREFKFNSFGTNSLKLMSLVIEKSEENIF